MAFPFFDIKEQEKQGQINFCNDDAIPIKMIDITKEELEKLGFIFGKKIDNLFIEAKLPNNWKKTPSPRSSFWTYIYDENGKERFYVFYKAAHYDRRAHIIPND